jgi:hypothetical protein
MSQSLSSRNTTLIVLVLALVQFALQMSLLTGGVKYIAGSLAIDDTYYYLQTAWNTKQLGFVTFDGLHPTNGVQLLWFFIILLLAMMAPTKTVLLVATLSVTFLLNGLCYFIIFKIGSLLKQPGLALIMAGLWALQSLPFRIYSTGMENSLHALIFWCGIWQCTLFLLRVQHGDKPNWWGLTTVLILNAWTRLDSALFSTLLYAFCVGRLAFSYRNNVQLFLQQHGKAIAGSSLFAGVGFIAQLTTFRLMGDSFLPVSALVKTSGASRGLSADSVDKFVEVITLGMPSILQGRFPSFVLVSLGLLGILLVIRERRWGRNHSEEVRIFLSLWLCLLVVELLYHLYIAVSGAQYTPYFMWYRSPSFIFWIITASLLALFTFERVVHSNNSLRVLKGAPIGFSLILFVVAIYLFARSINFSSGLYVARYEAAEWVADNSAPDTVFAAWNTGQLAFFSNRRFINLDGVINDVDYYERVLRGSLPLTDYLAENKVEYLMDYATYDSIPDFPVIRTFPINDGSGRAIQIWQISPPISSMP